jgi:hypothetical protein
MQANYSTLNIAHVGYEENNNKHALSLTTYNRYKYMNFCSTFRTFSEKK